MYPFDADADAEADNSVVVLRPHHLGDHRHLDQHQHGRQRRVRHPPDRRFEV